MISGEFVSTLIEPMPTPGARMAAVSVLARWAGQTVYIPTESKTLRRQRAAKNMLDNKMESPDVARALCARFGVSDRTAYRDVRNARKMS